MLSYYFSLLTVDARLSFTSSRTCLGSMIITASALSHPDHMILVSLNSKLYTVFEHRGRLPSQYFHGSIRGNRISQVVAFAVFYIGD